MDPSSGFPAGNPPRRELQGPRPAPLRVNRESHKIKKPPAPPHHPPQPSRKPMIYYEASPKTIHVKPRDFMDVVQRLTGNPSSTSSSSNEGAGGAMTPAARYATIEKARSPEGKKQQSGNELRIVEGVEMGAGFERTLPGILSPGPASIPPIPGNFFSPGCDPTSLGFFQDFSPAIHGSFVPSPSNIFSPQINSPLFPADPYHNLTDFPDFMNR